MYEANYFREPGFTEPHHVVSCGPRIQIRVANSFNGRSHLFVNDLQVGVCHEIRGRKLSHRIELGKAAAELYANNNEALQGRIDSEIESSDHRASEHLERYEHSNERSGNLRKLSNSLDIHREDLHAAVARGTIVEG